MLRPRTLTRTSENFMKSGLNTITILAVDIYGAPVLGLINSSWVISGQVEGNVISTGTVTEAFTGGGYYFVEVTLPVGQGFIAVTNTNAAILVAPTFTDVEVDLNSIDDLYGKYAVIGIENLPATSPNRYSVITLNVKQNTDITEVIQIPTRYLPLTGYTAMTLQVYPPTRVTDGTVAAYTGTCTATVLDAIAGTVSIFIDNAVIAGRIANGSSSIVAYGEIKYLDSAGNTRRPVELQITLRREFST
jgi:hypothetical protein